MAHYLKAKFILKGDQGPSSNNGADVEVGGDHTRDAGENS